MDFAHVAAAEASEAPESSKVASCCLFGIVRCHFTVALNGQKSQSPAFLYPIAFIHSAFINQSLAPFISGHLSHLYAAAATTAD